MTLTGARLSLAASMYRSGRTFEEIGALMGWPWTTTRWRLITLAGIVPRRKATRPCQLHNRRSANGRRCLECHAARMRAWRANGAALRQATTATPRSPLALPQGHTDGEDAAEGHRRAGNRVAKGVT